MGEPVQSEDFEARRLRLALMNDPEAGRATELVMRDVRAREAGKLCVDRAAIQWDGTVYGYPRPARHSDCIVRMRTREGVIPPFKNNVQGFVLTDGSFVDRIRAANIAIEAGQIDQLKWPPQLFCEDLW